MSRLKRVTVLLFTLLVAIGHAAAHEGGGGGGGGNGGEGGRDPSGPLLLDGTNSATRARGTNTLNREIEELAAVIQISAANIRDLKKSMSRLPKSDPYYRMGEELLKQTYPKIEAAIIQLEIYMRLAGYESGLKAVARRSRQAIR